MGELYGSVINATVKTSTEIDITFTTSGSYAVPAGYSMIDVFCVGGGSGGSAGKTGSNSSCGGGGGGGYTATIWNIAVSPGQVLDAVIGAGGAAKTPNRLAQVGNAGGASYISRAGTTLISANGGTNLTHNKSASGRHYCGLDGGSGGGNGGYFYDGNDGEYVKYVAKSGGSDGREGDGVDSLTYGGYGQGTITRAWGSSDGTLYAGGGGGGGGWYGNTLITRGAGGAGGGGYGGTSGGSASGNGAANTGGGGGGAGGGSAAVTGAGGTGVILLHIH